MITLSPRPTWHPSHKWGDGFLIREKQAKDLADLAEDILADEFPGKDFATCDAELGMVAITFMRRMQVAYLYVESEQHPRNIAIDKGILLADFVMAGWLAPVFDEESLPPASVRPRGCIPIARLSNYEIDHWIEEYRLMVADTKGGKRFRKKSWPDDLWRGEIGLHRYRDAVRFDLVPDGLVVVITTRPGATGTDNVMRPLARHEYGGGWAFAQLDCSVERDSMPYTH